VVLLLIANFRMGRRTGPVTRDEANEIEVVGLFWHFVDLIWILVFTFVYLI
jgi:heme/copper-type cytochrome/quinol oxidase subunit 3